LVNKTSKKDVQLLPINKFVPNVLKKYLREEIIFKIIKKEKNHKRKIFIDKKLMRKLII